MCIAKVSMMQVLGFVMLFGLLLSSPVSAKTRHYKFVVKEASYTRLCSTKNILTVNGQYPGPTIRARRGDFVIVRVFNHANTSLTLHWHGVDQPSNPWSDGPAYITQCPIQPGSNFTQRIQFTEEEGTIWWHAHSDWTRATVHGAIIVYPKRGSTFPFPKPHKEIRIILGEWWKSDVAAVLAEAQRTGGNPNISDSFTINGQPGDLYPCSKQGIFTAQVERGKTYLLRVINAAVNNELFFSVAEHRLTIVGRDAGYLKPFTTDYIMITPGQTMDILLVANRSIRNTTSNRYYMAARSFESNPVVGFDKTTTTAILEYTTNTSLPSSSPYFPSLLPINNDTQAATNFTSKYRSLADEDHPVDVPLTINKHMLITLSVNTLGCPGNSCQGPGGNRLAASLNNISYETAKIDILQAYYHGINGVYGDDFPDKPPLYFNFTDNNLPSTLWTALQATEVKVLDYNTSVEIVFQGTNLLGGANHPMHLHGHSFYVVGLGVGNFNNETDPARYNLVDPPFFNTAGVPSGGWLAIRFNAINPGVWLMHCHLDRHTSWGMDTVFIVKNGVGPEAQMLPPPPDMPKCPELGSQTTPLTSEV